MYSFIKYLLVAAPFILPGCVANNIVANSADVDPAGWKAADTAFVALENTDTVSLCDISFFALYDGGFAGGELPLRVTVYAPDSTWFCETVTAQMAALPKNSIAEATLPYRSLSQLLQTGTYRFCFVPDATSVKGIRAVGVKIIPAKQRQL